MRKASTILLWATLLATLTFLLFYLDAGLIAVVLYALILILLFASLMTRFWLEPIVCEREVSGDVVLVGQHVNVIVKITNRAPWPILWIYAEETMPPHLPRDGTTKRLLFLPPRRSFYLHYRVTPIRRGLHQIGPLVLESGDIFGLFKKFRVDDQRDFVTALPPYHVIEEFQVGQRRRLGGLAAERSIFEDPTRIRGIRPYQRGDAMKRIHWKSTARTGELRSKIYDPVMEAGATLVLDFHEDSWRNAHTLNEGSIPSEVGVELTCTIARYLSDGGWKLGLFSNGRDPLGLPGVTLAQARSTESLTEALHAARLGRPDDRLEPIAIRARRSPEQFSIIHENLGRIVLSDGLPIGELMIEELAHIDREQVLVVITGGVSDGFISAMLRACALGYRLMVFVVCNNREHDKAFDALVPHGVEVFRMDEQWRLREIATGRRSI